MLENLEIIVQYGFLLDRAFDSLLIEIPLEKKKFVDVDRPALDQIIKEYQVEWLKFESKIIQAITEITALKFSERVIIVHIVKNYMGAFSDPLVVSAKYPPDLFVDILTHELIHRIFNYNVQELPIRKINLTMFPDEKNITTLNHILVHAIHKKIYLDVLNAPNRLERDMGRCEKNPAYAKAWKTVQDGGYQEIIDEFIRNTHRV